MMSSSTNDNPALSSSRQSTAPPPPPILISNNNNSTSSSLLGRVGDGFRSLKGSPSELWKAYILKFLDSFSYFAFSLIFTLFLSADFGYSDVEAGTIYGAWGALITIYGLLAGFIIDNLGVATSLRVGFLLSLLARIFIFCTTSRTVLLWNVCVLLPMGNCLGIPVLTTGIRRYTTAENRGFAFGLFYVVMNVAGLLSGPVVDACTIVYDGEGKKNNDDGNRRTLLDDEGRPWTLSGYRLVILSGIFANIIAVVVTWTVREVKVHQATSPVPRLHNDDDNDENQPNTTSATSDANTVSDFTPLRGNAWAITMETFQSKRFWRFLVVCLITLNVRMIFRHLDATFPKYMVREFGDGVPKGTIYSINPALIILLVPLVTAATSNVDPLLMIHHGSYISTASVFFLVVSTSIWSSIAFVIVLSIGEAVWSPRLYDYTMSVSKEGREGTYGALASAPLFLAKLPVGFMSGYLLKKYCPEQGDRDSKTMWLVIGLTTAISPILMTIFWKYISHKDHDDEDHDIQYTELQVQGKGERNNPRLGDDRSTNNCQDGNSIT
jgi:proton-dependent oligopeptide transporter, POT family